MNQRDFILSMSGDAFSSLRSDFDQVLRSTLAGMIETEQGQAEINVKVKITLTDGSAPDYTVAGGQQTREITKPRFEHTVTAVIQRKEKVTGTFSGEYELVWDRDSGRYIARPIEDGQQTLFEDGEPERVDLGGDDRQGDVLMGLPEASEGDGGSGDGDVLGDGEEGESEQGVGAVDPAHDPTKPFGWLRQFIGQTMRVSEAMGNFAVRTNENKVVLSSATSPENPFYCPAEKLEPHIEHTLVCVGYGEDEIVNIAIECEDCNEVLYSLDAPGSEQDEHVADGSTEGEKAESGSADESGEGDDEDGQKIGYGDPEE